MALRTGGRFTLFTVIVTTSESAKEPSEAMNVTLYVPAWTNDGVQLNRPRLFKESTKVAPEGRLSADRTGVLRSGSLELMLKPNNWFSLVLRAPMAFSTGARFTLFTVMTTTSLSAKVASLAINVTLYVPAWVNDGVQVKRPLPFRESTKTAPAGRLTALKEGTVKSGAVALMLKASC